MRKVVYVDDLSPFCLTASRDFYTILPYKILFHYMVKLLEGFDGIGEEYLGTCKDTIVAIRKQQLETTLSSCLARLQDQTTRQLIEDIKRTLGDLYIFNCAEQHGDGCMLILSQKCSSSFSCINLLTLTYGYAILY